ncbi:MAG TPA: twin-arginine translocase TatA/TatE family subunit [Terriglobales bacterium]|nr:twin-arginine translocase TatA/TatE family subunit [Terriglobales bacterium]
MNLGFSEMAFIFLLALIIFGPKKLPEIGRQIGKVLAEFKRASNEFKWQLEAEMRQIEAEATKERLIKESKATEPAPSILPPTPNDEPKPKLPDAEIYPTTFGLEFRRTTPAPEPGSELVDVPDVTPPAAKGQDA